MRGGGGPPQFLPLMPGLMRHYFVCMEDATAARTLSLCTSPLVKTDRGGKLATLQALRRQLPVCAFSGLLRSLAVCKFNAIVHMQPTCSRKPACITRSCCLQDSARTGFLYSRSHSIVAYGECLLPSKE